jgi:hypothetical protein
MSMITKQVKQTQCLLWCPQMAWRVTSPHLWTFLITMVVYLVRCSWNPIGCSSLSWWWSCWWRWWEESFGMLRFYYVSSRRQNNGRQFPWHVCCQMDAFCLANLTQNSFLAGLQQSCLQSQSCHPSTLNTQLENICKRTTLTSSDLTARLLFFQR